MSAPLDALRLDARIARFLVESVVWRPLRMTVPTVRDGIRVMAASRRDRRAFVDSADSESTPETEFIIVSKRPTGTETVMDSIVPGYL